MQVYAPLRPRVAELRCAVPLLSYSRTRHSLPLRCSALHDRALPLHGLARPCQALPLQLGYFNSSHVNRPIPLFRHWPIPRNAP